MTRTRHKEESGFSLVEVLIAGLILMVIAAGVAGLIAVATTNTYSQGDEAERAAAYAQSKMEQLLAAPFSDTMLGGPNLSSTAGSVTTPTTGYYDYVLDDGTVPSPVPASQPADAAYIRMWQIDIHNGDSNTKYITVVAKPLLPGAKAAYVPSVTLISVMTQ